MEFFEKVLRLVPLILNLRRNSSRKFNAFTGFIHSIQESSNAFIRHILVPSPEDCLIDIMVDAYIPEYYIESDLLRIEAYRRIASIVTEEDARDVTDEFIDRYGDPPKSVMGLINIALVRNSAAALGIREITQAGSRAVFAMRSIEPEYPQKLIGKYGARLKFIQGEKPGFSIDISAKQPTAELVSEVVKTLKE